jgi:hypothetical protein
MKLIVNEYQGAGVLSKFSIYLQRDNILELEHLGYCFEEYTVGFTFACSYIKGEDFYVDLPFEEAMEVFVDKLRIAYNLPYKLEIEYHYYEL